MQDRAGNARCFLYSTAIYILELLAFSLREKKNESTRARAINTAQINPIVTCQSHADLLVLLTRYTEFFGEPQHQHQHQKPTPNYETKTG